MELSRYFTSENDKYVVKSFNSVHFVTAMSILAMLRVAFTPPVQSQLGARNGINVREKRKSMKQR